MKRRLWIAGLLVVLLAVAVYFWKSTPGQTPPGQPPLADVNSASLGAMKADFNRTSNSIRVIVLLSPT